MSAKDLLDRLGAALSVNAELSENNTCALQFDDVGVHFEVANGMLYALTELGVPKDVDSVARRLLEANFLGEKTNGATLALDRETGCVSLHTIFDENASYDFFEKRLSQFVLAARYWRVWIEYALDNDEDDLSQSEQNAADGSVLMV